MIISISGTPGTGKTDVAKIIAKDIGANLITIKNVIKKEKVPYNHDKERKTRIIDIKDLKKAVEKNIDNSKTNIIEGHLSHLIKSDIVVILRCNPKILEKRLKKRKWAKKKINENVLAEILDATTIEALEVNSRKNVFEIDTSRISADRTAKIALKIINRDAEKYLSGKIDWAEKYLRKKV